MPVEIIYKNRRQGADRRNFPAADHAPDRRNGPDRRKLDEKLKQLLENNMKNPNKEKPTTPSSSTAVILRKKGEGDKGIADKEPNEKERD
jgi:hypothetical protein